MTRKIFTTQADFAEIRKSGGLYVDKTKQIYDCLSKDKYYFLSRPRRFGKSLLCSTLRELFLGNKKLFKDLWIEKSDWKWEIHPVIHLDMTKAAGDNNSVKNMTEALCNQLSDVAKYYGVKIDFEQELANVFERLIVALHKKTKKGVVIIIDEYDKPILDLIDKPDKRVIIHEELRSFYAPLKPLEKHLRFVLLTGVYKFTQTSIFSNLNNLQDLTFDRFAADLIGYTQKEVEANFAPEIKVLASKRDVSVTSFLRDLREQCNGYVFAIDTDTGESAQSVYNSFAINTIFARSSFKVEAWFGTGTPRFLIKQLALNDFEPIRIDNFQVSSSALINSCEPDAITIETLLYFAGYVTLKSYDDGVFTLAYPNIAIARAMAEEIVPRMTEKRVMVSKRAAQMLRDAWLDKDFDRAQECLNVCLGLLHNKLYTSAENYFQTVIMLFFQMADMNVQAEFGTHLGYIDVLLRTKHEIYIIEIKMDKPTKVAIKQIKERRYYQGLKAERKSIFLVGMRCSSKKRAATDLKIEAMG